MLRIPFIGGVHIWWLALADNLLARNWFKVLRKTYYLLASTSPLVEKIVRIICVYVWPWCLLDGHHNRH
jgi:hypothetical protein